ncbi:outer membrane receptor protein involved in Fe transport [Dyadobacter jejuensis]|uniref:Outer membrane receptor protein involved in Fe transport n=1 Tax=Dyadobacter jejuensis TaxID=1082580 RepID=A0A316B363_9BACT|nr:TonB-dependent receptor [Dyadobacter jejuensis]PWJ56997.1 outer membrane receptor protein involved in Fe transport [Dyadobacter jejuensis]
MKNTILKICLMGLVLLGNYSLQAQSKSTISGYVKDVANGEGLIGVSVYVREAQTGVTTNTYGFYSITLPSGNYNVVYSYIGYEKRIKTIDLTTDQTLNIELGSESEQLQEVTVSTRRDDENVRSIEMSVNKVDMKTIKKMPALLGEVDLIRSIQLLPGVTTVGEGASGFNVRGGDVSQNLVLLDEAPVYNSSHLFGFFSVFNPDAVKDVKLIKGGIPAQYGGRISSILDVRMKEGNSKKREVNGGIGTIFSRLTYEQPFAKGKGSFIVAGRRSYIDILSKPFLKKDLRDSKFNFYDLTAKVNYQLGNKDTFFASGYFGKDVFGGGDFGFGWGNATATGRWNHIFSNKLFMNLTGYYSNYDYSLGQNTNDPNAKDKFDWKSKIISTSIKPDFTYYLTPNNQLTFGGQYIRYDSRPGKATAISEGETTDISLEPRYADESALYIGNEQKLGRVSLQYGLRYSFYRSLGPSTEYDYLEVEKGQRKLPIFPGTSYGDGDVIKTYGNWEPRFSVNVGITTNTSIKASYNRTSQYLHLLSNTAASSPLDVWTMSSAVIKPELADQIALGWFQNFRDNTFEASVEVYYKKLYNQIDYVPGSDLLLNQFVPGDLLFGDGRAYGAEFYLKKNKGKLTGWVSYTLSRTERKVETISNDNWFPARFDKPHNFTAVAIYDLTDRLALSSNFTITSGTPATFPTNRYGYNGWALGHNYDGTRNGSRIPAYHRLDLAATLKSKRKLFKTGDGEWVFSVYNVYNRRNPFSVYTQVNEDNALRTEAVKYSVIGSFIPSVTYNFKF